MNSAELRQAIFQRKASPVGKRIFWTPDQLGELREMIFSAPEKTLRAALPPRKFTTPRSDQVRAKLVEAGDMAPGGGDTSNASRFLFRISDESVDRAGDTISLAGWNLGAYARNPAVLLSHDSAALPVARSSIPTSSAGALVAVADFSGADALPAAAEVRNAVRAGLVKGASVGFIPLKWKLSSDPDRPIGLDFLQTELLEWSVCSVPCNANCVMLGVATGKAIRSDNLKPSPATADEKPDWQCRARTTMPIDSTDGAYDAAKEKAGLLEMCSASGSIGDAAADYFFAYNSSKPYLASSYRFPFCRIIGGVVIASKVGWRAAHEAAIKSDLGAAVISGAVAAMQQLEDRLRDGKRVPSRAERIAEVEALKRSLVGRL